MCQAHSKRLILNSFKIQILHSSLGWNPHFPAVKKSNRRIKLDKLEGNIQLEEQLQIRK